MLVGRQAEQQALDRLVAAARLGTSGVLALSGEAGVGKTALLDHAVEGMTEMRVLRATGLESEREIPFALLMQLVRPALGALEGIPAAQADALSAALALPTASVSVGGRDRFTIGAAVLSLICRFAEDGPVAVVVDDLHLADTASTNALVFAARRLTADPVIVLLGVRSPEGDQLIAGLPSMAVGGLDLDSARVLIERHRGQADTDEHVRLLHTATAGNPLALRELSAADPDVLESIETGMPLRVPRALVDAFGRRLAELDDRTRSVLLVTAVCGDDLRLIADVCDALELDADLLGDAENRGLVTVQGGRVEFRHPLLRAAAYSGAPVQQRRAAHRAAAGALPESDVDRRAWHLSEAIWHPDAGVADLLAAAGEHAIARAAYLVASNAFERSARLTPDAQERAIRLLRAADAAWTGGNGDHALALLGRRSRDGAADGASTALRETELRASIAARTGSLLEARGILLAAADRAERPDDVVIALADAVHAGFYLGDARMAGALADRMAALQPLVREPRAQALGLMATGMARILAGGRGADEIRAAVPILEAEPSLSHDPRRLSWLMLAPLFLRDATSGARLRALVDDLRDAAGIGALPAVLFHVAVDQATTGPSWPRAEANFTEAIRLAAETGQDTERAMSLAGLCRLDARAGRADACRAHATEARALCVARDIHIGEVWIDQSVGDLELSLGHPEGAVAHFTELLSLLEVLQLDDADLSPAPELVDALARVGRRAQAQAVAEEFRGHAAAKGQAWACARAHRAAALVATEDEMDSWFASSFEWHEQTLDRFEHARTRLAYGERLRRAGRRVDARGELRAAVESFTELGAVVWRERAAAELTATGEHVRAAGENALDQLTPQELQVSLILADGSTTREAAAALFLSPKTVEYHLRKVYTKLGISSRGELAAVLARADPTT